MIIFTYQDCNKISSNQIRLKIISNSLIGEYLQQNLANCSFSHTHYSSIWWNESILEDLQWKLIYSKCRSRIILECIFRTSTASCSRMNSLEMSSSLLTPSISARYCLPSTSRFSWELLMDMWEENNWNDFIVLFLFHNSSLLTSFICGIKSTKSSTFSSNIIPAIYARLDPSRSSSHNRWKISEYYYTL